MKVADLQVPHDGIDGLPAYGDRASPGRAQGKQQGDAEPSAKQFAPVVSVTTLLVLTVATVFGLVAYLYGVVRLMRVQYLLETNATESGGPSRRTSPLASAYGAARRPVQAPHLGGRTWVRTKDFSLVRRVLYR